MTKLEKINLDDLPILTDKEFFDCLLQCLTQHHSDYENVTCRPEFTQDFLANYWLQLMQNAHFEYVPPVTVDDKGFDSIYRSVFEICESRINLRVTTAFALDCKKLADDEQIQSRNLFMLILLFISEWIEYYKDNYSTFTLSKHNRDVNECFNKLFKNIYQGTDKKFEEYIFDVNKENSFSSISPFLSTPNRSIYKADISCLNITPAFPKPAQDEIDRLSKENEELKKALLLKTQNQEKILSENAFQMQFVNDSVNKLREELSYALSQNERLEEENEELSKNVNKKSRNEERNGEEIQKLNDSLYGKNAELEQLKTLLSKVQAELRIVLIQLRYLQKVKDELQDEFVSFKHSFDDDGATLHDKWTDVKTLVDDLAAERQHNLSLSNQLQELQEEIQNRVNANFKEMEDLNKSFADTIEEKNHLQQELSRAKNELAESEILLSQKNVEIENIGEELLNFLSQNERLKEENEELSKAVNEKSRNEERNEKEIQKLNDSLDAKNAELEQLKSLLSKVQAELRTVLTHLRDLQKVKAELQDEFDAFKSSFDDDSATISNKFTDVKTLVDDLAAEQQQNLSLSNQLQELREEIRDTGCANFKEMEDLNKSFADTIEEKNHLQQELSRARNELAESGILLSQKEAETENIRDQMQSLNGSVNKLQMENDLNREELSNVLSQNDRLKEENEELSKTVNRKSRNEERNEEEIQKLNDSLDAKNTELGQLKTLLSKVQAELRIVLIQLRDLQQVKAELQDEFDSFKNSFDGNSAFISNKWTDVKTLVDDLAAERQHNLSLSNQLQELQEEVSSRERSRTPSLHDEGVRGCNSRRPSFTGPPLFDAANASELSSEPFDEADEMRLDSGFGSTETTPRDATAAVVPAAKQSFIRRNVSSIPNWTMLLSSFIILFTIYMHMVGAIVPSWIYIKVHHDELPPQ